jgi:hypothetical protein
MQPKFFTGAIVRHIHGPMTVGLLTPHGMILFGFTAGLGVTEDTGFAKVKTFAKPCNRWHKRHKSLRLRRYRLDLVPIKQM